MSEQEHATKEPEAGPTEPETERVNLTIEIGPPQTPYVYSNVVAVALSPMDLRLHFADVMPSGKSETKVGVILSPEHAADLVETLTEQLRSFEKQFGPLRTKGWNTAAKRLARRGPEHPEK
jgi:Protein of unknown function (DUF3467)